MNILFYGFRHSHLLSYYKKAVMHPAIHILAAVEEDAAARAQASEQLGVAFSDQSYEAWLNDPTVETVAIGTAYGDRGRAVIQALSHGKHVLCDKPICTSLEELEAIRKDSEYILKAVESINAITVNGPGDIGAQGKANALAQMVKCREETNRRLIDFYTKAIEAQTNVKDTFALDVISVLTDSDAINEDNVSDVLETLRYIR